MAGLPACYRGPTASTYRRVQQGWTEWALLFNGLGTSWSDLSAAARAGGSRTHPAQGILDLGSKEAE